VNYLISERFKSVQGEGVFAGTPMAFIRFVGCSVGKKICNACDTDFEVAHNWRGGGTFDNLELLAWAQDFPHICLTGGEPLNQDLEPFFEESGIEKTFHIETSGTVKIPKYLQESARLWLCVSPKPGFREDVVAEADEVKVIAPGLGSGEGWPTISDALRWAGYGKTVFLQPRNLRHEVDKNNLRIVQDLVLQYPQLRMSVQLHKILGVQ